jgi:hypothetical protein
MRMSITSRHDYHTGQLTTVPFRMMRFSRILCCLSHQKSCGEFKRKVGPSGFIASCMIEATDMSALSRSSFANRAKGGGTRDRGSCTTSPYIPGRSNRSSIRATTTGNWSRRSCRPNVERDSSLWHDDGWTPWPRSLVWKPGAKGPSCFSSPSPRGHSYHLIKTGRLAARSGALSLFKNCQLSGKLE